MFYKPEFNKPLIKNLEYIKKEFANIPLEFIKIAMCVNTKDPLRNWPVEKFAYLIDQISKSNNAIVLKVFIRNPLARHRNIILFPTGKKTSTAATTSHCIT